MPQRALALFGFLLFSVFIGMFVASCDVTGTVNMPDGGADVGLDASGDVADLTTEDVALDLVEETSLDAAELDATELDATSEDLVLDGVSDVADGVEETFDIPQPEGPAPYEFGLVQSPITPWVVERFRAIAAAGTSQNDEVFMKVGDSISASAAFLNCFASPVPNWGAYAGLASTVDAFNAVSLPGGSTSFNRTSAAVEVGRTASWALSGSPAPINVELAAIEPRFAVVMYGSNDIGWFGSDHAATLRWYGDNMLALVDRLLQQGVIPILSTIPPRDDSAADDYWVPTFNGFVRALAQARQVPLTDFHQTLLPLPSHGLGSDHLHPNVGPGGGCDLSASGLQYGQNTRNQITLEALDRVRRAFAGEPPPDAEVLSVEGQGVPSEPMRIASLPFVHSGDTSQSSSRALSLYSGCSATQNESGPEVVYELQIDTPSALRFAVVDGPGVDIDLHLLSGSVSESACIARAHTAFSRTLAPGTYYLVADTFVGSGGGEESGEYFLVVMPCAAGDPECQ
ncbi:MAG: hypothetical protein AUK47_07635 [Deltaproteobacteria bacterium CG2_30_63_29]|nr:MAG: hypothetical protein AUK47_07635 [Deltaproteobacteria bacterium CG2_30_63_29]